LASVEQSIVKAFIEEISFNRKRDNEEMRDAESGYDDDDKP